MLGRLSSDRTRAKGEATANRLLALAANCFRTKGYANTTTRELAGLLGIQGGSLYHYIGGKEDLLFEVCMESLEHVRQTVEQVIEAHSEPKERLRALILAYVQTALDDRDALATMLMEIRALSDARRAEVLRLRDANTGLIRRIIADAQSAGSVRSDVPAKHLTLALLNLLNWTIFWFSPEGELKPAQLGELLATVFMSGVDTPAGEARQTTYATSAAKL